MPRACAVPVMSGGARVQNTLIFRFRLLPRCFHYATLRAGHVDAATPPCVILMLPRLRRYLPDTIFCRRCFFAMSTPRCFHATPLPSISPVFAADMLSLRHAAIDYCYALCCLILLCSCYARCCHCLFFIRVSLFFATPIWITRHTLPGCRCRLPYGLRCHSAAERSS